MFHVLVFRDCLYLSTDWISYLRLFLLDNHRLDSAVLEAASPDSSSSLGGSQRQVSLTSLMEPVAEDLQILNRNLQAVRIALSFVLNLDLQFYKSRSKT